MTRAYGKKSDPRQFVLWIHPFLEGADLIRGQGRRMSTPLSWVMRLTALRVGESFGTKTYSQSVIRPIMQCLFNVSLPLPWIQGSQLQESEFFEPKWKSRLD